VKPQRKVKKLLSDEDFLKVMNQFDITLFTGYRDYTVCLLIFDTGCRIGEALNIKLPDIDFRHRMILITNSKNKKQRYVFYSAEMERHLKRWLKFWDRYTDSDWLFPTTRYEVTNQKF
jgi:integrase/recombinase XerD